MMTGSPAMFERLPLPVPLHHVSAFIELKEIVEEAARKRPRIRHPDPKAVVNRIDLIAEIVDRLLEERHDWLQRHPGRTSPFLQETENSITSYLSEAEFITHTLQVSMIRKNAACVVIQRAVLTFLYAPNGGVPVISNSLKRAGMIGDDDGAFGSIDDGDPDSDA